MVSFDLKAIKSIPLIVIIGFAAFVVFFASFKTISAGTVGVTTRFGQVTGRVLYPGAHFILPFIEDVLVYNTRKVIYEATTLEKQQLSRADYKDYPVDTNTKDGQQVDIFYTIRFSIDPSKVTWIAQNIGDELQVVDKIVKTESRVWVRNIPREFSADQLYTGSIQEIINLMETRLRPTFEANGMILDAAGIREIKFSQQYVQAIEAKQIEAVKVETEKNKAEQAKFQKEAKITQAEAQAREQELLRQSITVELLRKMWIDKWDGHLPNVVAGENGNLLIQLPDSAK